MKSSLVIVALVATTIGLGTILPAVAQPAAATHQWHNGPRQAMAPDRTMGPARLLMLACSDKGAEALEIGLVRMSHRLDLTADQQKLFDTFRAKALTTQTSFADSCKAARPDTTAATRPDALARLKAGLAIDQARLTALNDLLPDFEALFTSLSDQQKADFLPHHGVGKPGGHGRGGIDRNGAASAPRPS